MSLEISLKDLAKSQLLTLKGEPVSDSLSPADAAVSSTLPAAQKDYAARLQDSVIDKKYKIISLLGIGGMGAVYKAHHLMLKKDVALKTFLSPNLTGDSWQRFEREAKAIARLTHHNIVKVFDFGVGENNIPYYTMEYLQGESLAERLSRVGPLPVDQAVDLFVQVSQAMSAAHNKGIVHRDLKPANIFLSAEKEATSKSDLVKIVDFGIASLASQSHDDQKLTRIGAVFGSPLYMSPEQSLGAEVTIRSDIYSCGCALFETLTGHPPFRGNNALDTMLQHQEWPLPSMETESVGQAFPQRLKALLTKMLAKQPHERYQSMLEVSSELLAIAGRRAPADGGEDSFSASAAALNAGGESAEASSGPFIKAFFIGGTAIMILMAAAASIYWSQHQSVAPAIRSVRLTARAPNAGSLAAAKQIKAKDSYGELPDINISNPESGTVAESRSAPPLAVTEKYLRNPHAGSSEGRRFFFPGKQSFGRLFWLPIAGAKGPKIEKGDREAISSLLIPAECRLELKAGPALSAHPELFKGFGSNDLWSLWFSENNDWTDEHLAFICPLTGLRSLNIAEINVSDGCLQYIQKLPNLDHLIISGTAITGSGLAKLKRLNQLTLLKASGIHTFRDALGTLVKADRLETIAAADCNLNDGEMKQISTISTVTSLDVSQNDFSEAGLESICKLPKLNQLTLDKTKITPGCVTVLKKAKNLKFLVVTQLDSQDQFRLGKALPGCTVDRGEKRRLYDGALFNK